MRIAISGTHGTGKSTLVELLTRALPGHHSVPEPYYTLLDAGFEFATPPTSEQFELLIQESCRALRLNRRNVVFDRCPLDYMAYLEAVAPSLDDALQTAAREAISTLDVLVYVPLTAEVRSTLPPASFEPLRELVDETLRRRLFDDSSRLSQDVTVIELDGPLALRTKTLLALLQPLADSGRGVQSS